MKHYERQIEEFYGPLFNMVNQVFVANHVKWELLKTSNGEAAEKCSEYFHNTYFIPLHDEIKGILKSKLYLVEGAQIPESFYLYLKHAAQERDQIHLWKILGIDTSFLKGEPWPEYFFDDIETGFKAAMQNYEVSNSIE